MDKEGEIELQDIEEAFDVEALSDEFFGKYKEFYEQFVQYVTGKRFVKSGGKWKEKKIHEPHEQMYAAFGRNDKYVRDYVKKMMGRIVFLHFLQKKGWMGVPKDKNWGEGDVEFMLHLFEYSSEKQKENFWMKFWNLCLQMVWILTALQRMISLIRMWHCLKEVR